MSFYDIFFKFLPGDFHPPIYYLILKFWTSVFGFSEISLRIPSVIFGILTIYVVYLIGKKLINKKVGLIASALLATSGLHVYYSQEARMYALVTLLISYLVYLFLNKKWLLFSITLLLIGLTDYIALFIIPVFWIIDKKLWKKLAIAHLPLVLGFAVWSPVFIKQLNSGVSIKGSNWWNTLGTPTFKNILLIPIKFIFGRITIDNKIIYGVVSGAAALFYGALMLLRRPLKDHPLKVIWFWFSIPIALGIVISFFVPTLTYFRYLYTIPAFYLLVASGLTQLKGVWFKLALGLALLINIGSTCTYLFNSRFHREDWRAAAGAIGSKKIILPGNSQKEALIYYGKGNQIVSTTDLDKTDNEIWLSRYVWEIFDSSDLVRSRIESLGYNKASEYNFNGVIFFKYARSY
jgi:4-amino-4-deoxy-L-arabinose transferase-like glycosyltransferase